MEMLILLNGILIACNVHFLIKNARKPKTSGAQAQEPKREKSSQASQWENMMNYNGTKQEVTLDED